MRGSMPPGEKAAHAGEVSVRNLMWVFASVIVIGICAAASPARAAVVRACNVENPPANCEKMWAVIAHVMLPKQPIPLGTPPPRCGSKFDSINWGMIVADSFKVEADPGKLENLAMDVSDAFKNKAVPQITRHIRGDAGTFIESNFSVRTPKAWSTNRSPEADDLAWCAPAIATVPVNATVRGFRFRAWDEELGEMGCAAGQECSIGHSRFLCGPSQTQNDEIAVYTAIFQNWSTGGPREGRLIIFFEMPPGNVPQQHL
jgi:hypothetical protein